MYQCCLLFIGKPPCPNLNVTETLMYPCWAKAKLGYRSLTDFSSPFILSLYSKVNMAAEIVMHLGDGTTRVNKSIVVFSVN